MTLENTPIQNTPIKEVARPEFTPPQLLQTQFVGDILESHRGRKLVKTHPIDNVEPEVSADRDDGIFVETETISHKGKERYRVHITIADVAGHVRLGSPLADAAIQRGFTVYGPGWTDSMFPKILEEKMSLEHEKERLGFCVTIDLDENFSPIHREWQPVITKSENVSYKQATIRMENDPQFQLMGKIAAGIRQYYFSKYKNSRFINDTFNDKQFGNEVGGNYPSSTDMVATYMLLANNCVADFFDKTGLPLLYRNFDGVNENDRAYYSSELNNHAALENMGVTGPYCHFTSPIRRAADFLNAQMAHFAFEVIEGLEKDILKQHPSSNEKKLHTALWDEAAEIFQLTETAKNSGNIRDKANLKKILQHIIIQNCELEHHNISREVNNLVSWLVQQNPPLSAEQLDDYAQHINELSQSKKYRSIAKQAQKHNADLDFLEKADDFSFASMPGDKFSNILNSAAKIGEMPASLYQEAMKRIGQNNFDTVRDGTAILVIAHYPNMRSWNNLKRAVLRKIKHEPNNVNAILEKAANYLGSERLQERSVNFPDKSGAFLLDDGMSEKIDHIHGAIISLAGEEGAPMVASPFYSVGHNARAALSHARYSFLEHYAFGQLQPIEQIAVPNLLYAELDNTGSSKREVVTQILKDIDAKLQIDTYIEDGQYITNVCVSGGPFIVPITAQASRDSSEQAEQVALRRLLREATFKHTVSQSFDLEYMLHPQRALQEMVDQAGGILKINDPHPVTGKKSGFQVKVSVTTQDKKQSFKGIGPNKDRAIRMACVEALNAFNWSLDVSTHHARSWATDDIKHNNSKTTEWQL